MGGVDSTLPGVLEPSVRDHSGKARILMAILESGRLTVSGGQFDWGGRLNIMGRFYCKIEGKFGYMLEHPFSINLLSRYCKFKRTFFVSLP